MQGLVDHLQALVDFLTRHRDVWDCSVVEIFNGPLLEIFPDDWMQALRASPGEDLLRIPTGYVKEDWPPSLKDFIRTAHRLSLNRSPTTAQPIPFPCKSPKASPSKSNTDHLRPHDCNPQVTHSSITAPLACPSRSNCGKPFPPGAPPPDGCKHNPPEKVQLDKVVAQGMSPKKRHEVAALAALVAKVANEAGATTVVDIGAGQGYLSNVLYYQYGLDVIAVDAAPGHAGVMQKRSASISKYFRNLRRKALQTKLVTNVPSNIRMESGLSRNEPAEALDSQSNNDDEVKEKGLGGGRAAVGWNDVSEGAMTSAAEGLLEGLIALTSRVDFGDAAAVLDTLRDALSKVPKRNGEGAGARLLDGPVVLAGLHACGNLSASMLRTFAACPGVKGVVVVSCCYNLVTEAPSEIPSDSVREVSQTGEHVASEGSGKPASCPPKFVDEPGNHALQNVPSECPRKPFTVQSERVRDSVTGSFANSREIQSQPQNTPIESTWEASDTPRSLPSNGLQTPDNCSSEGVREPPTRQQNGLAGSVQQTSNSSSSVPSESVRQPFISSKPVPFESCCNPSNRSISDSFGSIRDDPVGSETPLAIATNVKGSSVREDKGSIESCPGCNSGPGEARSEPSGPENQSPRACSHQQYGFPLSAAVRATGFRGLGINGRMLACQSAARWRAQGGPGLADVIAKHTLRAAFQALLARHFPAVWRAKPVLGKQKKRPVGDAPGGVDGNGVPGESGSEVVEGCGEARSLDQNKVLCHSLKVENFRDSLSPPTHPQTRPETNGQIENPPVETDPQERGSPVVARGCDARKEAPNSASERARFLGFARESLQQLGLPEIADSAIGDVWESLLPFKDLVGPFWTLRTAMAGPLESLLLLDRHLFMRECTAVSGAAPHDDTLLTHQKVSTAKHSGVEMFPLFDPAVSPRNIVIVGQRG